ncbi:hypothetical protein [Nocardioides alcanivorans]|uniref:hypothetical protein n=1 Tax=Nocardioides alcanivorans TaxID=2897352 RepID=UPI001F441A1A|nr:hypothetical protein [Nocardioides alcanivorans]
MDHDEATAPFCQSAHEGIPGSRNRGRGPGGEQVQVFGGPGDEVGGEKCGTVTLRVHGKLRHIGIGRTHSRTHVILLIQDLDVRIINAITGELLRELTIDTNKDYQPRTLK